jgi:hypothetical protein
MAHLRQAAFGSESVYPSVLHFDHCSKRSTFGGLEGEAAKGAKGEDGLP